MDPHSPYKDGSIKLSCGRPALTCLGMCPLIIIELQKRLWKDPKNRLEIQEEQNHAGAVHILREVLIIWLAMRLCSFQLSDKFGACMDLCVGNLLSRVQGLLLPEPWAALAEAWTNHVWLIKHRNCYKISFEKSPNSTGILSEGQTDFHNYHT